MNHQSKNPRSTPIKSANDTLGQVLGTLGIGLGAGALSGVGLRAAQLVGTDRVKPYSPKHVIDKLRFRSSIGAPGMPSRLDLPFPVESGQPVTSPKPGDAKKVNPYQNSYDSFPGEVGPGGEPALPKRKTTMQKLVYSPLASVPVLGSPLRRYLEYKELLPRKKKADDSSLWNWPAAGIGGIAGLAGGYGLADMVMRPGRPKPVINDKYVLENLVKARDQYHKALLERFNMQKGLPTSRGGLHEELPPVEQPPVSKVSEALDREYAKFSKKAEGLLDAVGSIADSARNTWDNATGGIGNLGKNLLGGTLLAGTVALPTAYMVSKNRLNKTDPIEAEPDVNEKVYQAIRMRERARRAYGPPELFVNPVSFGLNEQSPGVRAAGNRLEKTKKAEDEDRVSEFVDKLFG